MKRLVKMMAILACSVCGGVVTAGKSPIRAKPISGLVSATTADSLNPRYFLIELFGWVIDDIDPQITEPTLIRAGQCCRS